MYFIYAAVILQVSLALIVQVSLPYNKTGRAGVLHNFIFTVQIIPYQYFNAQGSPIMS